VLAGLFLFSSVNLYGNFYLADWVFIHAELLTAVGDQGFVVSVIVYLVIATTKGSR